jgi:hypothetical protein
LFDNFRHLSSRQLFSVNRRAPIAPAKSRVALHKAARKPAFFRVVATRDNASFDCFKARLQAKEFQSGFKTPEVAPQLSVGRLTPPCD